MNTIREILKINEQELEMGLAGTPASWHAKYSKSAWVYVGNLDHSLTEGDVICVLSQYGEIEDFHLVREEDTGKSRGFAFCKYEDARSCVLAVDNFCGIQLCGRSLRVDHVENYRLPKHLIEKEEQATDGGSRTGAGHAYQGQELATEFSLKRGQDLFAPPPNGDDQDIDQETNDESREAKEKHKEARRQKREEKEKRKQERDRIRAEREERRRERRARKMQQEGSDDDWPRDRRKRERKRKDGDDASEKKKRRRKERKKPRKRMDSDDE